MYDSIHQPACSRREFLKFGLMMGAAAMGGVVDGRQANAETERSDMFMQKQMNRCRFPSSVAEWLTAHEVTKFRERWFQSMRNLWPGSGYRPSAFQHDTDYLTNSHVPYPDTIRETLGLFQGDERRPAEMTRDAWVASRAYAQSLAMKELQSPVKHPFIRTDIASFLKSLADHCKCFVHLHADLKQRAEQMYVMAGGTPSQCLQTIADSLGAVVIPLPYLTHYLLPKDYIPSLDHSASRCIGSPSGLLVQSFFRKDADQCSLFASMDAKFGALLNIAKAVKMDDDLLLKLTVSPPHPSGWEICQPSSLEPNRATDAYSYIWDGNQLAVPAMGFSADRRFPERILDQMYRYAKNRPVYFEFEYAGNPAHYRLACNGVWQKVGMFDICAYYEHEETLLTLQMRRNWDCEAAQCLPQETLLVAADAHLPVNGGYPCKKIAQFSPGSELLIMKYQSGSENQQAVTIRGFETVMQHSTVISLER